MKSTLALLACILFSVTGTLSQTPDVVIHFETSSDIPDDASNPVLEEWIKQHENSKASPVILGGHTDHHADQSFNEDLSRRRSENIRKRLMEAGYSDVRSSFYGESWPVCSEGNEECDYKNRRVELVLIDTPLEQFKAKQDTDIPQVFFLYPTKLFEIIGKDGTKISMAANSLTNRGADVKGEVRCELNEFYSKEDIILSHMNTMHNQEILETGGMIEIRMFEGNTELQLKPDAKVDLVFATQVKNPDKDMQLFRGEIVEGRMNWQLNENETIASDGSEFITADNIQWTVMMVPSGAPRGEFEEGFAAPFYTQQQLDSLRKEQEKITLEWKANREVQERKIKESKEIAHQFGLKSLGYANCDAIRRYQSLAELNINRVSEDKGSYLVVLEDDNIFLNPWTGWPSQGGILFHAVPANESISIIYIEKTENGNRFARKSGTVKSLQNAQLEPEILSTEELKGKMATI